ncbi:uncharacterized protein LOC129249912 [Anastrepha obliqua]|uniref:uncharacterized protein LOC129249912 n=1 Tax=Anastrepha obliqua TaxID=95512 RepID=UPI00240A1617|nr:uncharacterized protein LOC129249912 [Anastrepha obliqua]
MTRYSVMKQRASRHPQRYPTACRLCDARHPVRLCPVFRGKSPIERLREALLGHYCANCLSMAHNSRNCTSEGRCRRCGDHHHTMLHISEERRSWSQQVAEEDSDVVSVNASDDLAETPIPDQTTAGAETRPFRPVVAAAGTRPRRTTVGRGSETRPLRPLLQHERRRERESETTPLHTRMDRGSETRPLRPQLQHERRRERGAETRPFRPRTRTTLVRQQPRRNARLATRPRQRALPPAFRAGDLIPGHALRPVATIMPTAVIKIEAGGRLHLVRALIDACLPVTIIASGLARDLGLLSTQVGGQRGCVITIRGRNGSQKRVVTHAAVVPEFQRVTPFRSVDPGIAAPYIHMRLADSKFFESTPIRLVIGAEIYASVMTQETLPRSLSTLMAQGSIFGWVLSGVCPLH